MPDGNLEYIGRVDTQIKINGYRIEIKEVEYALQQHEDLSQAAVVAITDSANNKKLVGYLVAGEFMPSEAEIRLFLESKLPPYRVPSTLVFLDKLPLTSNGKLDIDALPRIENNFSYVQYLIKDQKVESGILSGKIELLPIQKWFFLNKFSHINHFNQSFTVKVPSLNINRLKKCIYQLVEP